MEQQCEDREARIGAGLIAGLVAFVLVALVSFYFQKPTQELPQQQLSNNARDVASTPR